MKTTSCTEQLVKVYAFSAAPKCGAKTRSGLPCKAPSIRFKKRCRMHGGINSGAPKQNQNALKHGFTTKKYKCFQKQISELLDNCNQLLVSY